MYFRRLQVSHANEILLRTVRLSVCGLSGSKLEAMGAEDHGLGASDVSVLSPDGGCLAKELNEGSGEDARSDSIG